MSQVSSWYPRPRCPYPGPYPYPPYPQQHGTLPDSNVGWRHHHRGWCCGHWDPVKGYGIDLDGDGRYTRGRDGILAFDFNRDGRVDDREIERSNRMLKAYGGDFDANGDGRVSERERRRGEALQRRAQGMDQDGDGVLSTWELDRAGGRMFIDRDRDGRVDRGETHSLYNFPDPYGGSRRLDYVDPYWGGAQTSPSWYNPWWYPPSGPRW